MYYIFGYCYYIFNDIHIWLHDSVVHGVIYVVILSRIICHNVKRILFRFCQHPFKYGHNILRSLRNHTFTLRRQKSCRLGAAWGCSSLGCRGLEGRSPQGAERLGEAEGLKAAAPPGTERLEGPPADSEMQVPSPGKTRIR